MFFTNCIHLCRTLRPSTLCNCRALKGLHYSTRPNAVTCSSSRLILLQQMNCAMLGRSGTHTPRRFCLHNQHTWKLSQLTTTFLSLWLCHLDNLDRSGRRRDAFNRRVKNTVGTRPDSSAQILKCVPVWARGACGSFVRQVYFAAGDISTRRSPAHGYDTCLVGRCQICCGPTQKTSVFSFTHLCHTEPKYSQFECPTMRCVRENMQAGES